ncbi:MAG TPA: alpha/beta hydrolase [Rhodopila sp.]|jgi:acetyl esterase/lipase
MSVLAKWGLLSQAERDAAYDNLAAVADSKVLNVAREVASSVFRTTNCLHLDLRYGKMERNTWDLFPQRDPDAPCIVFIHGGYWQRNSKDQFANLISGAYARGWSAALPGYTLAPNASLTEIVAEINAALDWLAAHGPAHGLNGPVVLSGWSAGGHLTAMCLGHRLVKAGLAISGIYELGPVRDTNLNDKLRLTEQEIVALSPLRLPPVAKPLAIAYGTDELPALVSDSRDLHALRSTAHVPGALIPIPRANHFTALHELRDPDGILTRYLPLLLPQR